MRGKCEAVHAAAEGNNQPKCGERETERQFAKVHSLGRGKTPAGIPLALNAPMHTQIHVLLVSTPCARLFWLVANRRERITLLDVAFIQLGVSRVLQARA